MQNAPYLHVWNYNLNSDSYTISAGKPNTIVLCVQDVISKILYGSLSSFHWAPSGLQVVLRRFSTENDLVRLLVTKKKKKRTHNQKTMQNHPKAPKKQCRSKYRDSILLSYMCTCRARSDRRAGYTIHGLKFFFQSVKTGQYKVGRFHGFN